MLTVAAVDAATVESVAVDETMVVILSPLLSDMNLGGRCG
jgi:hypothetical protein